MKTTPNTGMEEFFTRDVNNEGIQVPLFRPDGTKSDHWIKIAGQYSDRFIKARSSLMRQASTIAKIDNPEERETAIYENGLKLTASLVLDWSFEKPCTPENVVDFLRQAPQIANAIDGVASQQVLFLKSSSKSSGDTSNGSETSASPSPDQPAQSGTN
jgi:hypothetical protein